MQRIKGILILFTVAVISALTVFYGGVSLAFSVRESDVVIPPASTEDGLESVEIKPDIEQNTASNSEITQESAVETTERGTVSGKILSKTITSSSATHKSGGVAIKNISNKEIDIESLLSKKPNIKITKENPSVLILHTHTTESYMLENRDYYTTADTSRTTDNTKNMASVGDKIASELTAAGFSVLHDTTLHDYPSYNGSYSNSAGTIEKYLKKYPSVKIVIDVHRDAIGGSDSEKVKTVCDINGSPAAQVMLVMGSGYGNYKQNLCLAAHFQSKLESLFPGLARPIYITNKSYNEGMTTGSMLIEIGTDANTLAEAQYSGTLVGRALAELLGELL